VSNFLNHPAPRPGEDLKVPAGAPDVCFMARFPGLMDLSRESHVETNVTVWPIFSALSADNLLTICEHALAPLGRVVFVSQYPILLSSALVLSCAFLRSHGLPVATETVRYILELRGWTYVEAVSGDQSFDLSLVATFIMPCMRETSKYDSIGCQTSS
jgi:hypothetical protein